MKSKRANDYIVEYQHYENGRFVLDIGDVNVVGLIAEEDMAEKAAKAFCAVHCPKGCPFDNNEECGALREFKRKMEE